MLPIEQPGYMNTVRPPEPERILPRDMTSSGTLPGTTDIAINDTRVLISGRNRAFRVTDASGTDIVTMGRSGSSYGLFTGSTNLYGGGTSGQPLVSAGAGAAPTWTNLTESGITLADVTTLDVSTTKHGLVPKAPNDTTKFLRGDATWATVSSPWTLLDTGSGTTTNASAENVDTIALSGLTALDTIIVYFSFSSVTQDTDVPQLYSVTNSTVLTYLNESGAAATADLQYFGDVLIMTTQHDNTVYNAVSRLVKPTAAGGNDATAKTFGKATDLSTAFTGSWTLGFRHGGVTAGGTFRWSWRVYKLAGQ